MYTVTNINQWSKGYDLLKMYLYILKCSFFIKITFSLPFHISLEKLFSLNRLENYTLLNLNI